MIVLNYIKMEDVMEKESGTNYFVTRGTLIVALPEEVDAYCCDKIRSEIIGYLQNYEIYRITFDFSRTHFMDSSGIGLLLYFYKRLKGQHGALFLYGEDARMEKILKMSGIYQIMPHVNQKS